MSRGKNARRAAAVRVAVESDEVSRLTRERDEQAARARSAETDAAATSALRARVVELERRLDAATSPRIEALRAEVVKQREVGRDSTEAVARTLARVVRDYSAELTDPEWQELIVLLGGEIATLFPDFASRRTTRRNLQHFKGKPGALGDYMSKAHRLA